MSVDPSRRVELVDCTGLHDSPRWSGEKISDYGPGHAERIELLASVAGLMVRVGDAYSTAVTADELRAAHADALRYLGEARARALEVSCRPQVERAAAAIVTLYSECLADLS